MSRREFCPLPGNPHCASLSAQNVVLAAVCRWYLSLPDHRHAWWEERILQGCVSGGVAAPHVALIDFTMHHPAGRTTAAASALAPGLARPRVTSRESTP
jgi:hypothetical protein